MKENYACALDELRAIEGYCPDHFDENDLVQKECAGYIRDHYRTVRIALEGAVNNMSHQTVGNTEILMFIIGWQGGTIHQLADAMGVPTWRIMNATYDDMQDLMRLAQQKRASTKPAVPKEVVEALRYAKEQMLIFKDDAFCDHQTGICSCEYWRCIEKIDKALAQHNAGKKE